MDNDMSVEFGDVNDNFFLAVGATASSEAMMRVDMDMNVTVDDEDLIRILVKDMTVVWDGTTLIGEYSTTDDSTNSITQPTSKPTTVPTESGTETLMFSDINMLLRDADEELDEQGLADFELTLEEYSPLKK